MSGTRGYGVRCRALLIAILTSPVRSGGWGGETRFIYTKKRMKGIRHTGVITKMLTAADVGIGGTTAVEVVGILMIMARQGALSLMSLLPKAVLLG